MLQLGVFALFNSLLCCASSIISLLMTYWSGEWRLGGCGDLWLLRSSSLNFTGCRKTGADLISISVSCFNCIEMIGTHFMTHKRKNPQI